MTGRLHQVHAEFAPAEDRILLKFNTVNREELRFWLTRKFVKSFWDALQKLLVESGRAARQHDPALKKALVELDQERAAPPERFNQAFAAKPDAFPLGEAPVLVTGFTYAAPTRAGKSGHIAFETASGHEVALPADATLLHSLSKMLSAINAKTGWDLALVPGYALGEAPARPARVH
jgi:hypothetical protein